VAISFIGGGNWSTSKKPPTYRKSQKYCVVVWKEERKACKQFVFLSISKALARDHRGRDRMVVGFKTTFAVSAYHH
jgi:hypothetical protein